MLVSTKKTKNMNIEIFMMSTHKTEESSESFLT